MNAVEAFARMILMISKKSTYDPVQNILQFYTVLVQFAFSISKTELSRENFM